MQDDSDDDHEANVFWGEMILAIRKEIVASLLIGNDSQCFTIEQYQAAYRQKWPPPEGMDGLRRETADMHLRTLGTLVEVSPGLWRAKS